MARENGLLLVFFGSIYSGSNVVFRLAAAIVLNPMMYVPLTAYNKQGLAVLH